jgi:hypothetical protein
MAWTFCVPCKVSEPEDITLASSYEALNDNIQLGVTTVRFDNTVTGRDRLRSQIQSELETNKIRYFNEPNNANLALRAGLLADEWTQELATQIERTARGYEGEIDLAVLHTQGNSPEFRIENADEILEQMQEINRAQEIERRYTEHSRSLSPIAWFVNLINPSVNREDLAAELAVREVDGQDTTRFLLGLLIPFIGTRTVLRNHADLIHPRQSSEPASSAPEVTDQTPNLASEYQMRNMDRQAMDSILTDTSPTVDNVDASQNVQGYSFDNFELAQGTQIRVLDARIQVQNPSDLNNVEFTDATGAIIHVTTPNTPPYIVNFENREVFINANSSDGSATNLSMDITGKLSYYRNELPAETPAPTTQDPEPTTVA